MRYIETVEKLSFQTRSGIQLIRKFVQILDSRFHGNDREERFLQFLTSLTLVIPLFVYEELTQQIERDNVYIVLKGGSWMAGAIGTTLLGEKRMSVRVGKSVNDPPLPVMFPQETLSNGRLATIPDIVDVLLHNQLRDATLPPYITTMSAEYAGLSRTGIPLIVVAHGVGPMSTPELAQEFYDGASNRLAYKECWFWKSILAEKNSPYEGDKDIIQWRAYNNLRVRCLPQDSKFQNEFWKLCDGDYGPVEIVEMRMIGRLLKSSFAGQLWFHRALLHPLAKARLGSRAEELLMRRYAINEGQPVISLIKSSYDSLERYADLQRGPVGYLLTIGSSLFPYLSMGFWKPGFGVRFVRISGDGPLAEIRPGFGDIDFTNRRSVS